MDGGRACATDGELGQVGYMLPAGAPVDIGSAGKYRYQGARFLKLISD